MSVIISISDIYLFSVSDRKNRVFTSYLTNNVWYSLKGASGTFTDNVFLPRLHVLRKLLTLYSANFCQY